MRTPTEIEFRFDVPPGVALPELTDLAGVAAVTEPVETELEATYYDTADLRLAARRIALRRRTGGTDQGWQLKIELGDERRSETWLPLNGGAAVPAALARDVRAVTRTSPLTPVAMLRTTRVQRRLLGEDGTAMALLADDTVRSEPTDATAARNAWREIEIELVDQNRSLLSALGERLASAGLHRSGHTWKLERALGRRFPDPFSRPEPDRRSTAADALLSYLQEQVDDLICHDRAARRIEPEGVHLMRVATRRLRGALATFRPLLDRVHADALREDLGWLGSALGHPRDAEVLLGRLHGLLDNQPPGLVTDQVRQWVDQEVGGAHQRGYEALLAVLDDERYLQLLDALDWLLRSPPLTERAHRPAARELPDLLARACWRVATAAEAAEAAESSVERLRRLHAVRKAAKRARAAGECAAPVVGKRAAGLAERMRAVQDILGEHRDSVITRNALRELGRRAHQAGADGFGFGLLHGLEHGLSQSAERAYRRAVRAALRAGPPLAARQERARQERAR